MPLYIQPISWNLRCGNFASTPVCLSVPNRSFSQPWKQNKLFSGIPDLQKRGGEKSTLLKGSFFCLCYLCTISLLSKGWCLNPDLNWKANFKCLNRANKNKKKMRVNMWFFSPLLPNKKKFFSSLLSPEQNPVGNIFGLIATTLATTQHPPSFFFFHQCSLPAFLSLHIYTEDSRKEAMHTIFCPVVKLKIGMLSTLIQKVRSYRKNQKILLLNL